MTVYSYSRLSTYLQCPLRFKLRYIDKAEPEFKQTVEAFLGSTVHTVLEKLYRDLKYRKIMSLKEMLALYRRQWAEKWNEDIKIVRPEYGHENYRSMGEKYLTDYYHRFQPFDQETQIALEQRVFIRFGPHEEYQLQGFIDRLSCTPDDTYVIHDYKTSGTLPHQIEADEDKQLALYAIAVKEHYRDCRKVRLVWHYLAFDKDVLSERTEPELEGLKAEIGGIIDQIESTVDFPPHKSVLCGWCEYRPLCPFFSHLYKTDRLPAGDRLHEEGHRLVDRYRSAKQKEAEIKDEIERIRAAIFAYGEREGMQILYGSTDKARLWSRRCVRLPKKEDPQSAELKEILKGLGKFEEVAALDTWALAKIIEDEKWPVEIIAQLKQFGHWEWVKKIYLSKR
jgi:putative RecB family exonuclease